MMCMPNKLTTVFCVNKYYPTKIQQFSLTHTICRSTMSHCATASKSMQQFYREKSGIEVQVIGIHNKPGKKNSRFQM